MCGSMVDIQCPKAEIRQGNKKDRKKKPQNENIHVHILLCRVAINKTSCSENLFSCSCKCWRWLIAKKNDFYEFFKIQWLHFTGELDKFVMSWHGISQDSTYQQLLKFAFLTELCKKNK